jgi:hypothetical protein
VLNVYLKYRINIITFNCVRKILFKYFDRTLLWCSGVKKISIIIYIPSDTLNFFKQTSAIIVAALSICSIVTF